MSPIELAETLRLHALWIKGDPKGAHANLARANLAHADLYGANLARANLARANLARANLYGANLARANLAHANLAHANLYGANLAHANLDGVRGLPDVPVVPKLDAEILARIEKDPAALDMGDWHSCETTHCRAGWAIHLAGAEGYALEKRFGPQLAGSLIYWASTKSIPNFMASDRDALADIRACAAKQTERALRSRPRW